MGILGFPRRSRQGRVCRGRTGVALTEAVVAVTVLALILATVPPVLVLLVQSQFHWSEQRVAESLSRNQVEYVKVAAYIPGNQTHPLPEYATVLTAGSTYDVNVIAQPIDPDTKLPLQGGDDEGMQEITVQVYHTERLVLQTVNYKIDRLDVLSL